MGAAYVLENSIHPEFPTKDEKRKEKEKEYDCTYMKKTRLWLARWMDESKEKLLKYGKISIIFTFYTRHGLLTFFCHVEQFCKIIFIFLCDTCANSVFCRRSFIYYEMHSKTPYC